MENTKKKDSSIKKTQIKTKKTNENQKKPTPIRHSWETYEDKALSLIVNQTSKMNIGWNRISELIKLYYDSNKIKYKIIRNGKQCRERWLYYLSNTQKKGWTFEEEIKMYRLVKEKGRKWSELVNELNKSDQEIKNHYYWCYMKKVRKISNGLLLRNKKDIDKRVVNILKSKGEAYNLLKNRIEYLDLNEENVLSCLYKASSNSELNNISCPEKYLIDDGVKYDSQYKNINENSNESCQDEEDSKCEDENENKNEGDKDNTSTNLGNIVKKENKKKESIENKENQSKSKKKYEKNTKKQSKKEGPALLNMQKRYSSNEMSISNFEYEKLNKNSKQEIDEENKLINKKLILNNTNMNKNQNFQFHTKQTFKSNNNINNLFTTNNLYAQNSILNYFDDENYLHSNFNEFDILRSPIKSAFHSTLSNVKVNEKEEIREDYQDKDLDFFIKTRQTQEEAREEAKEEEREPRFLNQKSKERKESQLKIEKEKLISTKNFFHLDNLLYNKNISSVDKFDFFSEKLNEASNMFSFSK